MSAKQISSTANRADPNRGSKEVEQEELPPGHVQRSRQQRSQHPHAEQESRQKNRGGPVSLEQSIAPLHRLRPNGKNIPVAFDQRTPSVSPQRKAQLSARGRGHNPNHNDPENLQFMFGISQEAGQQ